jgi:hypothetical protein
VELSEFPKNLAKQSVNKNTQAVASSYFPVMSFARVSAFA